MISISLMDWTVPWKYEIPKLYDASVWDWVLKYIKTSIHSMADIGFIIFGIIMAFSIIVIINKHFAHVASIHKGVNKRSLSREIFNADIKRNLNDVVDNKVKDMEVNFLAKNRHHQKNFKLEVRDKLNSMEVNYIAQKEFKNNSSYKANADKYYNKKDNHSKKRKGK